MIKSAVYPGSAFFLSLNCSLDKTVKTITLLNAE